MTGQGSITWFKTVPSSALADYGVAGTVAGGKAVALYLVDGNYFATSDICTHGAANLSDGELVDDVIECPLHQGMFNVKTGEAVRMPCTIAVATYPVKLEDGYLHVGIEEKD